MPFQLEDGSGFVVLESAGQIWLENDSSGVKWPRCCCVSAPAKGCTPDNDCGGWPKTNLTFSWTMTPGFGCTTTSGSFALVYNNDDAHPRWVQNCEPYLPACYNLAVALNCAADSGGTSFMLTVDAHSLSLCADPPSGCKWLGTGSAKLILKDHTCTPLHFHWSPIEGFPNACDNLGTIGYTAFYVDE